MVNIDMPILGHIFQKKDKKGFKKISHPRAKFKDGSVKKDFKPALQGAPVKKSVNTKKTQKNLRKLSASVMKSEQAHFAHNVIVKPHISEKSVSKNNEGKYVFEIHKGVSKQQIAKAIEILYDVKVEKVNRISVPRKSKMYKRIKGKQSRYDKAVVTLKKGQEIEVLPQ